MNQILAFSLTVFAGFFAMMNPIANVPVFFGLVERKKAAGRRKIAKIACIVAFVIVFVFVVLGKYIFQLFGLTVPAFKITGGILIFYVGFEMLMSKKSKVQNNDEIDEDNDVAISPLAIPILAGPGTIVTGMNFVTKGDYLYVAIVIAVLALVLILNYISFLLSERIMERLGSNLIAVIGKIMGLVLAIIGMGMLTEGIRMSFHL